ncbi:Splicing factor-like protein [Trema orientale]|uniref:Splicing factor-like protein n=1 Tax=Trema orientale TaxID=63057 RepID=A0A2P5FEE9_TREOI|nr:Splicing factor-like protein [Trema orientale]
MDDHSQLGHYRGLHGQFEPKSSYEGIMVRGSIGHRDSASGKLRRYFKKYGEITDSVIMYDKQSGRPRGYGFVEVKRTVPREDLEAKGASKTKKIFVGGLPRYLANDELRAHFSLYGGIIEYQIVLDHESGRSRGFGFVTFENEDAVEQIFSQRKLNELGGKQVEIKWAERKRAGGDNSGNATTKFDGFGGTAAGHGGRYSNKMGQSYGGYGIYDAYGKFGGSYSGNYAGFYCGYGGYLMDLDMVDLCMYGNGAGAGVSFDPSNGYDRSGGSVARRYHPYSK